VAVHLNTGWIRPKVPLENTFTIVDDLALPLDKIRIRPSGSSAGHNGLKDIENILGTDAYPKLRFGIGNNFPKGMQANYVLGKWFKEEEPVVKHKIEVCMEVMESFITAGIEQTMTVYNKLSIKQ
jgi:Peptidyl-tRNA hydrolase